MQDKELIKRNAFLESKVDHLETELVNLNSMLVTCGFPSGIQTLKDVISEILSENPDAKTQKNPNSIDLL